VCRSGAGQRQRYVDLHLHQRVPSGQPAGHDGTTHRPGDLARPGAGRVLPVDGECCRRQRGEVGRGLGSVPRGDGAADVHGDQQCRHDHGDPGGRPHGGGPGVPGTGDAVTDAHDLLL
jgi:hypothetical protein